MRFFPLTVACSDEDDAGDGDDCDDDGDGDGDGNNDDHDEEDDNDNDDQRQRLHLTGVASCAFLVSSDSILFLNPITSSIVHGGCF